MPEFGDSSQTERKLSEIQPSIESDIERQITNQEAEQLVLKIQDLFIDPKIGLFPADEFEVGELYAKEATYELDGQEVFVEMSRQSNESGEPTYTVYKVEVFHRRILKNHNILTEGDIYEVSIIGDEENYVTTFQHLTGETDATTGLRIPTVHQQKGRIAVQSDGDLSPDAHPEAAAINQMGTISPEKYQNIMELLGRLTPDHRVDDET